MAYNDEIRIRLRGDKDRNGDDYYVGYVSMPGSIDARNLIVLFFPNEDPENESRFGGDLVFKIKTERKKSDSTKNEPTDSNDEGIEDQQETEGQTRRRVRG
jgi:hypothetical protein